MSEPVIRLEGVTRTFAGGYRVLDVVNLAVEQHEFIAIMGRSGSGKTTLLNILGLLDRATSGSYRLLGEPVVAAKEGRRARLRADMIGFVFQASHLLPDRTAMENVELALEYSARSRSERADTAARALEQVGLGTRLHARPATLSAGERQRVAIARAMAVEPQILLCDEPTGNLDSKTARSVVRLVAEAPLRGASVVLVTHDRQVADTADRILEVHDGRLTG